MFFLQAAIGAGLILFVFFGIYIVIGLRILVPLFFKLLLKKRENGELRRSTPYYSRPFPYVISLMLSISILLPVFYGLILLFDKFFPDFLKYS